MFFTCKNFMRSDFMWKKNFAAGNGGGLTPPSLSPHFPTALHIEQTNQTHRVRNVMTSSVFKSNFLSPDKSF